MARILFIDDDPVSLEILGKAAEMLGHSPSFLEKIENSDTVIQAIRATQPNLVIVDLLMPNIDGMTILEALRTNPETTSIPVVILSAGTGYDDPDRAYSAGAQAFLYKPISLTQLQNIIDTFSLVP